MTLIFLYFRQYLRVGNDGTTADDAFALLSQWRKKLVTPEQMAAELVGAIKGVQLQHLAEKIAKGTYQFCFVLFCFAFWEKKNHQPTLKELSNNVSTFKSIWGAWH